MASRNLRSTVGPLEQGDQVMDSPTSALIQSTLDTLTKENSLSMKLKTPPEKNMESGKTTKSPADIPTNEAVSNKELQKAIADLAATVTTLNEGLTNDIKKAGTNRAEQMESLEKKILLSPEKKNEEVTLQIQSNYDLHETRIAKMEADDALLHSLLAENKEKSLAQSYKTGLLQQQFDQLQAQVNTNQTTSEIF
jgi:hypothetical protein